MQWLIDIAIEVMEQYLIDNPRYVDRGDPAAVDYAAGDFTRDSTWRELDLSAIVPVNAKAVSLVLILNQGTVNRKAYFRKHGNANSAVFSGAIAQITNLDIIGDLTVAVDADRKIDYNIDPGLGAVVDLTVKGWWL